jgi:hypothetical protein
LCKDIQDQISPVEHPDTQFLLNVSHLAGRKLIIENYYIDVLLY